MARTYNDIYYNDDENSTAEILDDMKKLAESVDQQIGSIKSFNNDTSQFIEQVTPLMNTLSEQVIDMHQLADTMFTELEQVKEENKQLREDLNGLPKGQASGETIDLSDSAEMRCDLKISGNSEQEATPSPDYPSEVESCGDNGSINEVICNKNLFDKNNPQYLDGYGLNTTSFFARGDQRTYIIPVPQNKENITVSYTKNLTGSRYYAFADEIPTDESSSHYGRIMFANSSDTGKITFTAKNNNYKYLLIGSITSEVFTDLQVEQNPTATSYEEHQEQSYTIPTQQPFRAIGNVRDKFILKENGKWYERHYTYRKIFDGTESFGDILSNNKRYYFMYNTLNPLPKAISNNGITPEILSNKLTKVSVNNLISSNKQGIAYNTEGKVYIYTETTSTMNNKQFRTWLSEQYNAGTPLYVDYILKTPIDIECTEEQSTILFDIEQNAKTYKGVTHMYSTDNVSPVIDVTYKKDIETLFANTLVEGV